MISERLSTVQAPRDVLTIDSIRGFGGDMNNNGCLPLTMNTIRSEETRHRAAPALLAGQAQWYGSAAERSRYVHRDGGE